MNRFLLLPLSLVLSFAGCGAPSSPDAGIDAGRPKVDAGVDAGLARCLEPKGAFMACTNPCDACTSAVAGFPLYALNHPDCVFGACSALTRTACPEACPTPSSADVGSPAQFTLGVSYDAGPAVSGVLGRPFQTTLLTLPTGTRFVVIRPQAELAQCQPAVLNGLLLMFRPSIDGGAVAPGRYPVSTVYEPPPGTVSARLDTAWLGVDGSVTLTNVGATTTGAFELELLGAMGRKNAAGAFDAVECVSR